MAACHLVSPVTVPPRPADSAIAGRARTRLRLIPGALLGLALLVQPCVATRAAERSVRQYTHQRWSREIDAPRPAIALAQDRRGYLWIAAATGLFRFDGIRFMAMSAGVDLVRNGAPSALLVRRNGEVWTNFERSGLFAVYRDGRLSPLTNAPRAPHRVVAMEEAPDRTVWVLTEQMGVPLMRLRDGRWTTFGVAAGAPIDNPFSMVLAADGTVWVSFSGGVARLVHGEGRLQILRRARGMTGRLSIDPEGRVWLTERAGTYPLTGPGGVGDPPPLRHAYATDPAEIRGWPRFDRAGNLWIATYYDGIERVAHPDPRGAASAGEARSAVEHFTERDGLSSNAASRIAQDAEGNIWVATEGGIDRFGPATVRFEPQLTHPAAFGDLLLAASDGSVYIGEAHIVYRVRPRGSPEPILRTRVEPRTLCEAPDGAIWIGIDKDLLVWRNGRVRRLPSVPVDFTIYDCAFDAHGDYWVTAARGGMARFSNGRWHRQFGPTGPAFLPKSMIVDGQGQLVIHWSDDVVARLGGGRRQSARIPFGDYEPDDVMLYRVAPGRLFVGGGFGLARLQDGRFRTLSARRFPALSGINGMVRAPSGDTWLAVPGGLLRVGRVALERAFSDPAAALPMLSFGAADGLRSRPHSHSRQSIVRGGDGRIWIATQSGTMWLDPGDIRRTRAAPRIAIGALTADRVHTDPQHVTLPAGTSRLNIDFAVFNFSNPRAARVRYRLEGQDSDWTDAGTQRTAFYTNLGPGTYRFHVVAANQDGLWNERGATLEIVIPPTFVQSRAFVALCIALALALLWLIHRLRVAQVARRIRARLEERSGERERIARELHDTLLQSVQGLVLRFQSVANRMPAGSSSRAHLEAALTRADEVITEGRDRVQDLRGAEESSDLPALLRARIADAGFDPAVAVGVTVEGRGRRLDSLVAVELGRIAGEALFNAAHHARARSVALVVRFSARSLEVEIRDDGVGIAPDVIEQGHRPGHFGLVGMRERAQRIGGAFSIESKVGMGSSVTIAVPARLAYADKSPRRRWLSRLFSSGKGLLRG